MNSIGGYFELEFQRGEEYHKNAIRLNSGRNAFELILKVKKYSKVFIPYYTCEAILEPLKKLTIDFEFYSINGAFEPIFNYKKIKHDEGFLYINYFGLKDSFTEYLSQHCRNLIIDNSQAFFAHPFQGVPTFYSCRKFFGVPDGAYLYLEDANTTDLKTDLSSDRFSHLLKRIETGAESGFSDYKKNELKFRNLPVMLMSDLTKSILVGIDYEDVKKIRVANYKFLRDHLSDINKLDLSFSDENVPMVYPFMSDDNDLKLKLIEKKIFIATYWTSVLNYTKKNSLENRLARDVVHLPIDQRYSKNEMNVIVKLCAPLLYQP